MNTLKTSMRFIKPVVIVLICLLLLAVSISIPVSSLKQVEVRRDYGLRGISLPDGAKAIAYLYATEEELGWYRDATEIWITDSEVYEKESSFDGTLVEIGQEPVTEEELLQKFGNNPELKKIIPQGTFYEIQVSFDPAVFGGSAEQEDIKTDQIPLSWVTDGDRSYALCRVYCKGLSKGSTYDHIWGELAERDGYVDSDS